MWASICVGRTLSFINPSTWIHQYDYPTFIVFVGLFTTSSLSYSYSKKICLFVWTSILRTTVPLINPFCRIHQYDYPTFIGGILLISRVQYSQVDGMSNKYWGWGLEDDEFFVRYRIDTWSFLEDNVSWLSVLRIRDPVPFWPQDPGWVIKSRSGFGIQDEHPGSLFRVKNT